MRFIIIVLLITAGFFIVDEVNDEQATYVLGWVVGACSMIISSVLPNMRG